jgi:hypothetical protein
MFVRPVAYNRVELSLGASLRLAIAINDNVRLGWTGLPGTKTPAYYKKINLRRKKSFIGSTPGPRRRGGMSRTRWRGAR